MKQFYAFQTSGVKDEEKDFEFVQPVLKMCVESSSDIAISIPFSDTSDSEHFILLGKTPIYFDFQSANNGGGVKRIRLTSGSSPQIVRVSVIEYGTGGNNNDWYK